MPSCLSYLSVSNTKKETLPNGNIKLKSTITNASTSPTAAFDIRVQPMDAAGNEQILPAIISDSYFSLMQGESKQVTIEFEPELVKQGNVFIKYSPYNSSTGANACITSPAVNTSGK